MPKFTGPLLIGAVAGWGLFMVINGMFPGLLKF